MKPVLTISPRPSLDAARRLLASANLPTADLAAAHCEHFFFAGPPDQPTGLIGLAIFGDVALLGYVETHARSKGIRAVYLLTTTAAPCFAQHGYTHAPREFAPAAIRSTREFAGICPASSAFMTRLLS